MKLSTYLNGEDIQWQGYPPYGMHPSHAIPRGFNGYMGIRCPDRRQVCVELPMRPSMRSMFIANETRPGWGNPTMLDSGASVNTVTSESMLYGARDLSNPIEIEGVGGIQKLDRVGQWSIFGLAAVNSSIPLNIVSLSSMEKLYDVKYSQGESYIMKTEVGNIMFKEDRAQCMVIV